MLAIITGSIVIGVAGTIILTRRLTQAILRMERATEKFAAGELAFRVYPPRIPQLAGLARGLNGMAIQLQDRVDALLQLTSEQDAILRSMVEGVITIDVQGRIMRVNEAATTLLGITTDSFVGRSVPEVIHHAELQRFIHDSVSVGALSSATVLVWSASSESYVEATATPLHALDGKVTGTLLVLHDVTRVRKLEEIRRDFVANVSHELKTPITSIKGFVETLLDGAMNEPEMLRKFLGIISRHADRLNAIFNDLLTLARLEVEGEDAQIELCDYPISDILEGAVETCMASAKAKGLELVHEGSRTVRGDVNASLLEQAVVNLLDNAIKYTDAGGRIAVSAEREGEWVRLSVEDNGSGIDKSHLPRLFERFYRVDTSRQRSSSDGSGLGLSIVD
jgi:two-component system phosphate regulon sensor histidine kinase PhoR